MKQQIKILDTTLQRLKSLNTACSGKLFGISLTDALYIVGLQLDKPGSPNLNYSLPAEIDFYGVFEAYDDGYDSQNIVSRCLEVEVTDNPIFLAVKYSQKDIHCNVVCNNQITSAKYSLVGKSEVFGNFVHARLGGELQFTCDASDKGVQDEFANLRKSFASGILSFQLPKLNLLLTTNDGENAVIGVSGDPTVDELIQEVNEEGYQKKRKNLEIFQTIILKKVTRDRNNSDVQSHAPVVILNKTDDLIRQCLYNSDITEQVQLISFPLKLDSLALIDKKSKVCKVYDVLLESAMRNLRLYEEALRKYLSNRHSGSTPQTMHFFPQDCGHFLTRIVFDENKDDRLTLHDILILSKNVPQFRKANQFFNDRNNGLLLNVHEGVKPTNNGGKVALVKGNYEYYHYCQQKMDDNGWGCAYRSLQTLASWFRLQGYTDKEVPAFKDIQKCLVDLGDKPQSFVDSRQWIGSTEVNYVLDSLLGITSKILFVSSGEEMSTKGPELLSHFENHGSPVMIGGGVLAHTILGVDYNQQTGTLFFLILDPHYTGGEDLAVIQNKGWCAWKGVNFWDKTAYYNMCLPQVPREV